MNEIKRLTDEHYINLDPWEMCGQDNYCKRGCHEKGGCTNGCKIPYIYNSLAMIENYEIKHGLKLVYGYNLLLINNNEDIKNPLDIMGRTYKIDRYAFSSMSSFCMIKDDTLIKPYRLCVFDFRDIVYSSINIEKISALLINFNGRHPNTKVVIIENKDKKIPQTIKFLSNVILEQHTEVNYKIIKSYPMAYEDNSYIKLEDIL